MMNPAETRDVVNRIAYRDWTLFLPTDASYLQVHFVADGDVQRGRKWRLSPHMTPSEIVQTAMAAVLAAEEHETREKFTYRGAAIFNPHFNVDALVTLISDGRHLDVRSPEPVE